jgi:hypothetical protein
MIALFWANIRFVSTPGIDIAGPDFRKGSEGGVCERPESIDGKFKSRHYPFRSSLFTPGGIA